jgi:ribonuclease HII
LEFLNCLNQFSGNCFIAGSDEVGRGPLAGPVVAATTLLALPADQNIEAIKKGMEKLLDLGVTDSKKLTQKKTPEDSQGLINQSTRDKSTFSLSDNRKFIHHF